jgi:hypothetical protein
MLQVGKLYRNGAGQVREILKIESGCVTFRVIDPGPDGDMKFSRLLMDQHYRIKFRSFEGWVYQEVEPCS